MTDNSTRAAGIDTGKAQLDIALSDGSANLAVPNTCEGHAHLAHWLRQHGIVRVGIEATGGYERAVAAKLSADGFELVRFQPRQVRAYGTYRHRLAKNDALDARLIAECAQDAKAPHRPIEERFEQLGDHLTLIEQTEEDIARLKTRLEATRLPRLRQIVQDQIAALKALRSAELADLLKNLRSHDDLARRFDLAVSVDGVGERTALALVIRMPELGSIENGQAAALAGLAPYDDDSGSRRGERHIKGGRSRLRKSLYAAALPAAFQWNAPLVTFYRRLREAGKPHKLALVAAARKLLTYVNTVVARGTVWVQKPQN